MKIFLFLLLSTFSLYLSAQPPGCTSGTDPVGAAGQQGLYGEYFLGYFNDNTSFFTSTAVTFTRIESTINYLSNNWSLSVPPFAGTATDQNTFSARYRGSIYIAVAGTYTFYLASDDASYLFLDNAALASPLVVANATINNGGAHGTTTVSASVVLTAGLHNLQIIYGENGGGNNLSFQYSCASPVIAQQVVPASILCTSIQAAIPPPPPPPPPPGCTGTDPGGNPAQSGLYGQYYAGYFADNQSYFNATVVGLTRIDPNLNFMLDNGWGAIVPPATGSVANPDSYSVRWRGSIYIAVAGTYTFYLLGDDACYMWIDAPAAASPPTTATALISNGGLHSPTTVSASRVLNVGLHAITIHYGENTGNNRLRLQYSCASPLIAQQDVPQSILCTSLSAAPLPIELLSFNAAVLPNKNVELKWVTASELNNNFFTVERSVNGIDFNSTGNMEGAGTSNEIHNYSLIDKLPLEGLSYYRLKQTDFDGNFTYSSIVPVNRDSYYQSLLVFPNPSSGIIQIEAYDLESDGLRTITIMDSKGGVVKTFSYSENSFLQSFSLPKGLYIINFLSTSGKSSTQKVFID